jgi:hypothetical protein
MRSLYAGALTVLLSSFILVGGASAEDGAGALLPFQGPQASKLRQSVQRGLGAADVELIPLGEVSAVVKKTKGYAKQAAKLEASVLIRVRTRRVEGRYIADTEVRDAKGRRVEKLRTSSSSLSRLSNRIVDQLIKTGRMPGAAGDAEVMPEAESEPPPPTQPRLVVRPFTGPQAGKIRGAAVRGLRSAPVELFPNAQFTDKAQSQGVDPTAPGGHVAPAAALEVTGLIDGDVLHEDGVWSAYVRLVDGQSTKVINQHFYEARTASALAKSVQTGVGSDFRKDLSKLGLGAPAAAAVAVAPVTEVTAAPSTKASDKSEPEAKPRATRPKEKRPAAVDVEVTFRLVHRTFAYSDVLLNDPRGDLRDYTLKIGPGVGIRFQYFPGAHFTSGVGAQFGIDFEWERVFEFDSTRLDEFGQELKFPTESQQFLIGARWRYPKGRWEPFVVADYGVHDFTFGVSSGSPVTTAGVPNVKYEFIRVGGGFRVAIGEKERFIVALNAAFRGVLSVGGIGTDLWFPEAKANGMDAMLMLGYALPKGFEIRIGGDYRRYWFDLNPVPGTAPYVAGGALDQYWDASIGLAWRR